MSALEPFFVAPAALMRTGPGTAQRAQQQLDQRADHAGRVAVAGAQHARQHVLTGEDVQRQVAVVVVVGVEVAALLLAVQRHMGGIHIEHQFLGRLGVAGDELLHEHFVQRGRMLGRGRGLQAAEGRCAGQRLGTANGRLHHQIVAQRVVVAHVRPAQAQAVDALRQQAAKAVLHAGTAPLIPKRVGRSAGQAKTLIDPLEQQHTAVADDIATVE